ncbi:hypothetical protein FOQG_19030 [Fusarium oxysporum f. sp. raphani 54005]|uniref:Uncharacterized protein n=1 Tax=Fusarium oxysporum f. sp. raphani 54005 TaxID=1089458 RepID=X0C0A8_FUSOX|nr:hypothetical protein FOQG_19030 [Fusarium oxysporum f. sp. raphani 54005]EXL39452.1 hypothetical protein FOCG_17935 [Fusarium oxysporum f. sp. radicis-lycopersici 26381]
MTKTKIPIRFSVTMRLTVTTQSLETTKPKPMKATMLIIQWCEMSPTWLCSLSFSNFYTSCVLPSALSVSTKVDRALHYLCSSVEYLASPKIASISYWRGSFVHTYLVSFTFNV